MVSRVFHFTDGISGSGTAFASKRLTRRVAAESTHQPPAFEALQRVPVAAMQRALPQDSAVGVELGILRYATHFAATGQSP